MSMETVRVTPGLLSPTMSATLKSPRVWAKLKAMPVINPGTERGSTTRENVRNGEAPRVAEAAISLRSTEEKEAAKGCTAKGRLETIERITKPAKVKARVWPVSDCHQRPNGLREPSATRT